MNEEQFQNALQALIEEAAGNEEISEYAGFITEEDRGMISSCRTFSDKGIFTNNKGLVIHLEDGSEFQLTIVQSK